MERLPIKSVSVEQDSHNCDIDKISSGFKFSEPDIEGCYCIEFGKFPDPCFCSECKAGICPDFFVCRLDLPDSHYYPLYWRPARSFEEAVEIFKAHPITSDMTYEERFAAQKARFGL